MLENVVKRVSLGTPENSTIQKLFIIIKSMLVATKVLSQQNYIWLEKISVSTKLLSRQIFVATNTCLWHQNMAFVTTKLCKYNFCRDKTINTCLLWYLSRQT